MARRSTTSPIKYQRQVSKDKPRKHYLCKNERDMTTQDTIITLFNNLTNKEKVETLTALYYTLRAGQKDEFLRETQNA
jgi:hypothetical protein